MSDKVTETSDESRKPPTSVYAGLFLVSLGVLMYQVLLTRIFSFTIWYHLAYLTVSTALLGFGAAGSVLAAFPSWQSGGPRRVCSAGSLAAAISAVAIMVILAPNPIDPATMQWRPYRFFGGLFAYYVLVLAPFFAAGIAIVSPLSSYPRYANRLYAVDLLGAGLGCLAAVLALTWLSGPAATLICGVVFAASAWCYSEAGKTRRVALVTLLIFALLTPLAHFIIRPEPAASKGLGGIIRRAESARRDTNPIVYTQWSAINRVDLHSGSQIAFWNGIGINPDFAGRTSMTLGLKYDAHNGSDVYRVRSMDDLEFLDYSILRASYLTLDHPKVLAIGVGGGVDVLNALRRGASHVTGAELQPITVQLHNTRLADFTGGMFQRPDVTLVAAEGRHFVRSSSEIYDLIQITATDTFSAQATGAYVLAESYLYTIEAIEDYLDHLSGDGVIGINVGDLLYRDPSIPPALGVRLVRSAEIALARKGAETPRDHIAALTQRNIADSIARLGEFEGAREGDQIAGSIIVHLLIKKSPFTPSELEDLRQFAEFNGFTVSLLPNTELPDPMSAVLNHSELEHSDRLADMVLDATPDDRPFFYHTLRWRSLLEGKDMLFYFPGSSTGLMMLLMMLAQAAVLGSVLIAAPLVRGASRSIPLTETAGFLVYFLSVGVGFMFVEISFIQKYVLLLGYPTYSLSITLFALLIFTGAGAALSEFAWKAPKMLVVTATLALAVIVWAEINAMPGLRERFLGEPLWTRAALTVAWQAPAGLVLGTYFTTGVELLRRRAPGLIPWAWAINGIGSVASTVLAVILAMAIGFSGVAVCALAVYATGVVSLIAASTLVDRRRAA